MSGLHFDSNAVTARHRPVPVDLLFWNMHCCSLRVVALDFLGFGKSDKLFKVCLQAEQAQANLSR